LRKLLEIPVLIVVLLLSLSISGLLITHLASVPHANTQQLNQKPLLLTNATLTNQISLDVDSMLQYKLLQQRTLMQHLFNSTRDNQAEQSKHLSRFKQMNKSQVLVLQLNQAQKD
jgi:hypothetical protein